MEKHHYLNFPMINQLPKIYSMMYIVNLMIFAVVVSQPVFFIMAITSFQKSVKLSPKKFLAKIRERIVFNRKFLNYSVLVIFIGSFLVINHSAESFLLIAFLLVLTATVARLFAIQKNDLPTSSLMHDCR